MDKNPNILIIIPARGGSKGIPRKNLRFLNGYPLISYVIKTCLKSRYIPDVYVSSEDDEILSNANRFGAEILKRKESLSEDLTTLDPVIYDAYQRISLKEGKDYKLIITVQPTSPLLRIQSLDQAIQKILNTDSIDTIISAKNDTHLTWKSEEGQYIPNYKKRINRQELPQVFKETGGFLITKSSIISQKSRIGPMVDLFELQGGEDIDIDTFEDWNLCEYYLKRKSILFVVTGNHQLGLGHVYNTLQLADGILNHNVLFLTDKQSQLAYDKIAQAYHRVYLQTSTNIIDDIKNINPDVIINDILDTGEAYVKSLKRLNYSVINFEDLGPGASHADLVINAMYPEKVKKENHFFGQDYFCLRSDFLYAEPQNNINKDVGRVLLTFGGVDPNNYTAKVLEEIYNFCIEQGIKIDVVLGMGFDKINSLKKFNKIQIHRNIPYLSDMVRDADLVFTSAGRTAFEIASIGIPAIIIAQNERENTHFFATSAFGFSNLGLGTNLSSGIVLREFKKLLNDYNQRLSMHELMRSHDIKKGKQTVISLINRNIDKHK